MRVKNAALDALAHGSTQDVSDTLGIPHRTIRDWADKSSAIRGHSGSQAARSMTKGRPEQLPCSSQLVSFMKDVRREEKVRLLLRCTHVLI